MSFLVFTIGLPALEIPEIKGKVIQQGQRKMVGSAAYFGSVQRQMHSPSP